MNIQYLPIDLSKICVSYFNQNEQNFYNNKWKNIPINDRIVLAAQNGWMNLLEWSLQKTNLGIYPVPLNNICRLAAYNGRVNVLNWLKENANKNARYCPKKPKSTYTYPWESWKCIDVINAEHIHLDVLKWIMAQSIKNDCRWDTITAAIVAFKGRIDVLIWIKSKIINTKRWDSNTCANAALGGHLNVLQWLYNNNCPWDSLTCAYAASAGHLDILKFAKQNGCSWDERTCSSAASNGHLDILIWAIQNECPLDDKICLHAKQTNQKHILNWLLENGCKCRGRYH